LTKNKTIIKYETTGEYIYMSFNSKDVLLHAAKFVKEREAEIEKNIELAKTVFEPFKEIYKKKKTVGILWWKKTMYEDVKITYRLLNKTNDVIVVTMLFDEDDIFSVIELFAKKSDMISYTQGVLEKTLHYQFVKLYEHGKPYLVKPIE
jgi:hypothetical protein